MNYRHPYNTRSNKRKRLLTEDVEQERLNNNISFYNLPYDIFIQIFTIIRLDKKTLMSLRLCCVKIYNIITKRFWDQFLKIQHVPSYIEDFKKNKKLLMSKCMIIYSPSGVSEKDTLIFLKDLNDLNLFVLTFYCEDKDSLYLILPYLPKTLQILYIHDMSKKDEKTLFHFVIEKTLPKNLLIGNLHFDDSTHISSLLNFKNFAEYFDLYNQFLIKGHGQINPFGMLAPYFDINHQDFLKSTPLIKFLQNIPQQKYDQDEINRIVKTFLFYGANTNTSNKYGSTPLHIACIKNLLHVVKLIYQNDEIKINDNLIHLKDIHGNTPFHYACQFGDKILLEFLIQFNPNINQENNKKQTPFMLCFINQNLAFHKNYDDLYTKVKLLLERNAKMFTIDDVEFLNYYNWINDTKLIKLLFDYGFNVQQRSSLTGDTLLFLACKGPDKNINTMQFLLSNGCDPNLKYMTDWTCLAYSVMKNSLTMTSMLIQHGANVNQKSIFKKTPLDIALSLQPICPQMIQLLVINDAKKSEELQNI